MTLIPGTKVTVNMKGLGVTNYNSTTETWDFAFIRGVPDHDLTVKIREFRLDSPSEREYVFKTDNVKDIEFRTTIGERRRAFDFPAYQPDLNFTGDTEKANYHDARWITDLTELHGEPVKLKLKQPPIEEKYTVSLTFMTFSAAVLYSSKLHDLEKPYFIYDVTNPGAPKEPPFSRVAADFIGLDIIWSDDKKTELFIDGEKVMELKDDPNLLFYEVQINNNCENINNTTSDFIYYYKHLVDMDKQFNEYFKRLPIVKDNIGTGIRTLSFEEMRITDNTDPQDPEKTYDCGCKRISELVGGVSLKDMLG